MTRRALWPPGVLLLAVLILGGCQRDTIHGYQAFVFGTLVEVKLRTADSDAAAAASEQLFTEFQRMHTTWHAWQPGSMGRVNNLLADGNWFTAPSSTLPILELSQHMYRLSGGLFNPAIGELIALWGFHADELPVRPPKPEDIAALVSANPGMDDIEFDGIRLRGRNQHLKIDVGGIAKGYAVDIGRQLLRDHGIEDALVNAGGDLCGSGDRGDRPWRIGIRHPGGSGVLASIDLAPGECVFTSGDYERFFTWEGRNYHHIIDPRSGYPADQASSVTVLHADGALADAASTALFIAGPEHWQAVARAMGVEHVLMVDRQQRLIMTPSMRERVTIETAEDQVIVVQPPS